MCERGMTIAAVIHQPRYALFMQFDNLILVGNGEPIYLGAIQDAQGYFEKRFGAVFPQNENPADFILDLVYEKQSTQENMRFDKKIEFAFENASRDFAIMVRESPDIVSQFSTQLNRGLEQFRSDALEFLIESLTVFFAAIVVGLVYGTDWEIRQFTVIAMLSCLALGTVSVASSLKVFSKNRLYFLREFNSGVDVLSFFLSKVSINLICVFLFPLIYGSVVHALLSPEISQLNFLIVFAALYWCTSGMGMFFSLVFTKNGLLTSIIITVILGGFLSGDFPDLNTFPDAIQFACGFSFSRWAVEALLSQQSQAMEALQIMNPLVDKLFFSGGFNETYFTTDLIMLLTIGLLLRFACLVLLQIRKDHDNKDMYLDSLENWVVTPAFMIAIFVSGVVMNKDDLSVFELLPLFFALSILLIYASFCHYYAFMYGSAYEFENYNVRLDTIFDSKTLIIFHFFVDLILYCGSLLFLIGLAQQNVLIYTGAGICAVCCSYKCFNQIMLYQKSYSLNSKLYVMFHVLFSVLCALNFVLAAFFDFAKITLFALIGLKSFYSFWSSLKNFRIHNRLFIFTFLFGLTFSIILFSQIVKTKLEVSLLDVYIFVFVAFLIMLVLYLLSGLMKGLFLSVLHLKFIIPQGYSIIGSLFYIFVAIYTMLDFFHFHEGFVYPHFYGSIWFLNSACLVQYNCSEAYLKNVTIYTEYGDRVYTKEMICDGNETHIIAAELFQRFGNNEDGLGYHDEDGLFYSSSLTHPNDAPSTVSLFFSLHYQAMNSSISNISSIDIRPFWSTFSWTNSYHQSSLIYSDKFIQISMYVRAYLGGQFIFWLYLPSAVLLILFGMVWILAIGGIRYPKRRLGVLVRLETALNEIVWIFPVGMFLSLFYAVFGIVFYIFSSTRILGKSFFKLAKHCLFPFYSNEEFKTDKNESFAYLPIWYFFGGILVFLVHLAMCLGFSLTVILLPIGLKHLQLAKACLNPSGLLLIDRNENAKESSLIQVLSSVRSFVSVSMFALQTIFFFCVLIFLPVLFFTTEYIEVSNASNSFMSYAYSLYIMPNVSYSDYHVPCIPSKFKGIVGPYPICPNTIHSRIFNNYGNTKTELWSPEAIETKANEKYFNMVLYNSGIGRNVTIDCSSVLETALKNGLSESESDSHKFSSSECFVELFPYFLVLGMDPLVSISIAGSLLSFLVFLIIAFFSFRGNWDIYSLNTWKSTIFLTLWNLSGMFALSIIYLAFGILQSLISLIGIWANIPFFQLSLRMFSPVQDGQILHSRYFGPTNFFVKVFFLPLPILIHFFFAMLCCFSFIFFEQGLVHYRYCNLLYKKLVFHKEHKKSYLL
jgi:uncharacterized membrane protein YccF (DUF307 family)